MLTQSRLREVLDYNPMTGIFNSTCGTKFNIGSDNGAGYLVASIDGKLYTMHRLAWLYVYGYFPEHDVDHRDGYTNHNWISNLRHVTRGCNLQNQKLSKANTSGFPGVTYCKAQRGYKQWKAQIQLKGKNHFLGQFDNPLDAALARFTFEANHPEWTCNYRSELVLAIKRVWPTFLPLLA